MRRALSRVLDTVDGVLEPTDLTRHLRQKFEDPADLVAFAGDASPAQFGAFAVDVTRQAAAGDTVAIRILQEAAEYIMAIVTSLGWEPGLPICLTGGIARFYKEYLPGEMQDDITTAVGEPLAGAIALAKDFFEEIANECR